ncbi:hypothetical protein KI387_006876 [Taxus chinensis]|uniref:Uncharacterized protein n=1 Tax=Taxus chinensis TaxID=29808 RepID=A0AA38GQX3_TAXCH|nr:hypothetical protein KI387_006876 [Taxus chinensis]
MQKGMMRSSKLQKIVVPKCKRSVRVKQRSQYAGFNWINLGFDPLRQGGMAHCSSNKDKSPKIFDRKMDLFYEMPISKDRRRGHDVSQNETMMFLERENKENLYKILERPCTELELATQSTISDSTENGCVGAMEYDAFDQYRFVEIPSSGTGSDAAEMFAPRV